MIDDEYIKREYPIRTGLSVVGGVFSLFIFIHEKGKKCKKYLTIKGRMPSNPTTTWHIL